MPVRVVFNAKQLKDTLINDGWEGVVYGKDEVREFVTIPTRLSSYPRLGFRFLSSGGDIQYYVITASAHEEGQAPSGWSDITSYSKCRGGIVLYHYPNEDLAIDTVYSVTYGGVTIFAKLYDPATYNHVGWFVMMEGGYSTVYKDVTESSINSTERYTTPKTYVSKLAIIRPLTYSGMIRGMIIDDLNNQFSMKIGEELFCRVRQRYLVRI